MSNTRVEYVSGDVPAGQLAPSQAGRTNFTPGLVGGKALDANWPTDFRIPTGTPAFDGESAGPVKIQRTVVVKTGRGIISDQTIPVPIESAPETTTLVDAARWGSTTPTSTLTPTATQELNGRQERGSGSNNIESA